MIRRLQSWLHLGIFSASFVAACSGEGGSDGASSTGGTSSGIAGAPSASGGSSNTATTSSTGGAVTSGSNGTGGGGVTTGGTNSGGTGPSATGTGGMLGTGGAPQGSGGTGTGGVSSAMGGGNTGGATALGGGNSPNSGGAGTGGTNTGGATSSTGGRSGRGGFGGASGTSTGGTFTTGGAFPSGGSASSGGGAAGLGGADGTGGAAPAETVCGTATEDEGVTLRCPEGQVIDSVVFASYGTPSGECGAFTTGACHASSSETTVGSLCVGRSSCTVTAANGAFGDPCSGTTKGVAVELACVVGEPTVTPSGPFKGVANSPADQIAALGATWCYNWGTSPQATDCDDPLFVPMIWGPGDVAGAIQRIGSAGYTTVLGFNEPNKSDQANMSVGEAIALWPDMTSDPNIRVGSPAVSDDGRAWLEDFMDQVDANGLRVDFIAMHWYGWNSGSCVVGQLQGAINWASQWGLPVWMTEFGCMGSSNPDEQTVLSFFGDAANLIQGLPLVERYAWYPWNTYNHLYEESAGGVMSITALGEAFAAAPQYR